jgi:hypothetical protein
VEGRQQGAAPDLRHHRVLPLIGLSVLVASVLGEGNYGDAGSIDFLQAEAKVLGEEIGLWFEYFFYIAGFAILFSTNIGIVDYVSRLTADSLKTGYLARSEFWSESKLYFVAAWIICIGGSILKQIVALLLPRLFQPASSTCTSPGPCIPTTSDISMSPERLGPVWKQTFAGRVLSAYF